MKIGQFVLKKREATLFNYSCGILSGLLLSKAEML